MTAKSTPETQAAIDRAAEDAREARNSLDPGATAEDWRAEAWQHRGTLPAQSAWFQLALKINESETTYRGLAKDCAARWDYAGAARWRAMADGLELARNHMEELAAQVRDQIAKQPVGSATQPPAASGIPIP